jgi:MFS family permease
MASLGLVLAGTYATGSVGVGGLMVTVYVVALTLCAPLTGRLLDRVGPATGTPYLLGFAALALSGLAAAVILKASALPLLLLAGLSGVFAAGSSAAMRSLLNQVVPARLLTPALSINSIAVDLTVVSGPLIVALAAIAAPPGAIVAMVAITAVGAFGVRRMREILSVTETARTANNSNSADTLVAGSLWRNRRFLFWMLVSVAFGHALGTAETGAFPLATELGGGTREAVLLIAALSVCSVSSGLAYAGLSHRLRISPPVQASVMLALMVIGSAGLGMSNTWPTAAVSMAVLGFCAAPLYTIRSVASEDDMPPGRRAEGFGTLFAANGLGFALGGLLLALLPLSWMLVAGGGSALVALLAAPVVMRGS